MIHITLTNLNFLWIEKHTTILSTGGLFYKFLIFFLSARSKGDAKGRRRIRKAASFVQKFWKKKFFWRNYLSIVLNPNFNLKLFFFSAAGTKCDAVFQVHLEKKNGHQYYKIDNFRIYYKFGKSRLDYSNLFKGNEELSKLKKTFIIPLVISFTL